MIAEIVINKTRSVILILKIPVAHNKPAVNSKESPGKKKPINKPVSAKTTNNKGKDSSM